MTNIRKLCFGVRPEDVAAFDHNNVIKRVP